MSPVAKASPMTRKDRIEEKLTTALSPQRLEIKDDSHKHEGHSGWREGGETHFRVEIVSDSFSGESRVNRQRRIYDILADELDSGLHALQLKALTPEEDAQR